MRQKNVGPNNHGDKQEGTSAERRDQEGPEGSNTPSRQERQDTSCPIFMETAPLYMAAEMQMMKEWMDFIMNALKGWVLSDLNELVHQTNSPFTTLVTSFPLPSKFRMPHVEAYNGSKDPLDHLKSFKTLMHLQGVADEIIC